MSRHPHGETVILHPYLPGEEDIYGNLTDGFGEDVERPGCAIAPRVQEEDAGGNRSMVAYGFEVYDTYDTPVGPHDELTVRGVRCKVDGEIARWRNPFTGRQFGAVITARRVDG